ncbi:1-phosphofructokinase family hexose kinase [Acetomicrobium sp.]|jgi:1-phosphofructokinase|uniref:1-phosphofructokinase family hexose kinase n=1 Tax=Acetomicrobium sp. TaxID=1872099 RepID=UPI003CAB2C53
MTSILTVTPNPGIDHTIFISDFTAGKVNRVKGERHDVGGKGFNVASFLKDYGIDDIAASGFLGRENKDLFEGFFIEREIKDEFIYLNGKTRTNIKIVDDIKNEITDINFPGLQCDKQSCHDLKDKLARLARRYEGFVLSGSLPPGAPADFFADITSTLKSLGKFVALDTSDQGKTGDYRSRIWSYHT